MINNFRFDPDKYSIGRALEQWADFIGGGIDRGELCLMFNRLIPLDVYNSCAIEGNGFSLDQVRTLLSTKREHGVETYHKDAIEVENLAHALRFVYGPAANQFDVLNNRSIREAHSIAMSRLMPDGEHEGRYRQCNVRIGGSQHIPPPSWRVPPEMQSLDMFIRSIAIGNHGGESPIFLAAKFHVWFEMIHPFADGNGRVGRAMMNVILLWHGYPPCIIDVRDRDEYIRALEHVSRSDGDLTPFLLLMGKSMNALLPEGQKFPRLRFFDEAMANMRRSNEALVQSTD